eukprot:1132899-Amphidinium_carterae.1
MCDRDICNRDDFLHRSNTREDEKRSQKVHAACPFLSVSLLPAEGSPKGSQGPAMTDSFRSRPKRLRPP